MELAPSKVPVYANYTARPYDIAAKELLDIYFKDLK